MGLVGGEIVDHLIRMVVKTVEDANLGVTGRHTGVIPDRECGGDRGLEGQQQQRPENGCLSYLIETYNMLSLP